MMFKSKASADDSVARAAATLFAKVRSLGTDLRAVAAVEFAMIAPIMFSMYFITVEAAQGIDTNKKVGRVGSMVADLVTQQSEVSTSQLTAIMKIGQSIMQPYNRSLPKIYITGINISAAPNSTVKVAWSWKFDDSNGVVEPSDFKTYLAKNAPATLPSTLNVPGTFIVRVDNNLAYLPIIAWTASQSKALGITQAFNNIAMGKTYYLRPRISSTIPCTDC